VQYIVEFMANAQPRQQPSYAKKNTVFRKSIES